MGKRKKSVKYSNGSKFNEFTLEVSLGSGGNGDVWRATKDSQPPLAIKILRTVTEETYERFKIETATLERMGHIKGVIPLIEKFIPESKAGPPPWFTMPVAVPFQEYIKGKKVKEIVEDFIKLAEVIAQLHEKSISHRDIKPANFLYFDSQLCLSDFGLVKYPERTNITPDKRDVGAKFTMAPEMRRSASAADGLPADVYSFTKSLWIALTGVELGFDGQYNPASTIGLSHYLPETYTTTLDRLFTECTETDPIRRPNINYVISRMREWLEICSDFHTRNLIEWTELTLNLFPLGAPTQTTWTNIDAICTVLNEISKIKALNHMFFPTGGGHTITGVSRAAERDMIALHVGEKIAEILKPAKLTFESFGSDTRWSYFRLEAAPVSPTGIEDALDSDGISEALTEIYPGEYAPYTCWDCKEINGDQLPESARPITRFLKGAFVFFSTRSVYNGDPSTYDARHNTMTEEAFRSYIERNSQRRSSI